LSYFNLAYPCRMSDSRASSAVGRENGFAANWASLCQESRATDFKRVGSTTYQWISNPKVLALANLMATYLEKLRLCLSLELR
jgi:hypothetical protein